MEEVVGSEKQLAQFDPGKDMIHQAQMGREERLGDGSDGGQGERVQAIVELIWS